MEATSSLEEHFVLMCAVGISSAVLLHFILQDYVSMQSNQLNVRIGSLIVILTLVLGIAAVSVFSMFGIPFLAMLGPTFTYLQYLVHELLDSRLEREE